MNFWHGELVAVLAHQTVPPLQHHDQQHWHSGIHHLQAHGAVDHRPPDVTFPATLARFFKTRPHYVTLASPPPTSPIFVAPTLRVRPSAVLQPNRRPSFKLTGRPTAAFNKRSNTLHGGFRSAGVTASGQAPHPAPAKARLGDDDPGLFLPT